MDKLLLSDWIQLVTVLGVVIAIISAIRAMTKNSQQESRDTAKAMAEMQADVKHILEKLDKLENIPERVTAVEESAKQAHKRIDELNRR